MFRGHRAPGLDTIFYDVLARKLLAGAAVAVLFRFNFDYKALQNSALDDQVQDNGRDAPSV